MSGTDDIEGAVRAILSGGIAAFPTDTVYGLAADMSNPEAVERLFALKGRDPNNPLPVMIPRIDMLKQVAREIPESARRLAENYLPGALTIVLKKSPAVPDKVSGGRDTVGIRIPDHKTALAILEGAGRPLAVTSANRSGEQCLLEYEDVVREFGDRVNIIVPGRVKYREVSTVVDCTVEPPVVLREGVVRLL